MPDVPGHPSTTWPELLTTLLGGGSLPADATSWAMHEIMTGQATPAQIAAFVTALRAKGETRDEVAGLVRAMRRHAVDLDLDDDLRLRAVDTCGTGGDRAHTVNLSTMAALVTAGAGVPVVKHGNRAASSACGSAEVLGALGVVVDLPAAAVAACLAEAGAGFCFAPRFHPSMRHAGPVRREIGVPTVFNVLGPLTNPARVAAQAIGVADARLAPVVAEVLAARGTAALVFRGDDGLDELTTATTSTVWVVAGGRVRTDTFDPADVGMAYSPIAELRGGDAEHNAAVARALLDGRAGAVRDATLLAAAAALVAAAGPTDAPVARQIADQLPRAADALDSGAAAGVLDRWVASSHRAAATALA
jgi:anthranilate phosphoribosyltransferase